MIDRRTILNEELLRCGRCRRRLGRDDWGIRVNGVFCCGEYECVCDNGYSWDDADEDEGMEMEEFPFPPCMNKLTIHGWVEPDDDCESMDGDESY